MAPGKLKRADTVQITNATPNAPQKLLDEVRAICLKELDAHPEDFHESDQKELVENDWTITRFLMRKKMNAKEAAAMMMSAARWRHKLGVHSWKDTGQWRVGTVIAKLCQFDDVCFGSQTFQKSSTRWALCFRTLAIARATLSCTCARDCIKSIPSSTS